MKKVVGQGHLSDQSGTSWYPVITASSNKVAVLIMSNINYVIHQYTNATQNYTNTTQHKSWQGSAMSDCSFSCCKSYFVIGFRLFFLNKPQWI